MSDYVNDNLLERASQAICSVKDCSGQHHAKTYCFKHYKRHLKGSDPNKSTIRDVRNVIIDGDIVCIPLGVNAMYGYAIVDRENEWIGNYKWTLGNHGYAVRDPKAYDPYLMHHLVIKKPDKGFDIDHKNRIKIDNTKSNLRVVTRSENNLNTLRSVMRRLRNV